MAQVRARGARVASGAASRILAAILVGASVGAVAKAYTAGGPARRPIALALGIDSVRLAAGVRDAAGSAAHGAARLSAQVAPAARAAVPALAWVALVLLVAVAVGSAARAWVLWRRARVGSAAAPAGAVAGGPPREQGTAAGAEVPNHSDAGRTTATHATPRATMLAKALTAWAGTLRRSVAESVAAQTRAARAAFGGTAPASAAAAGRPRQLRARPAAAPSQIHALAAAGASPAEIARRTGLPQDAVTLALSIAR
jgi:hypothetical protein